MLARTIEIVLVAVVYFVTAKIGQQFAIPPGNVTPVWIPSGVIVAWMLIRGYHIWPGIWLGAFVGNVSAYIDVSSFSAIGLAVASGSANGFGDSLGTLLGVYCLHQFKASNVLANGRNASLFVFLGCLVPSFISACMGVTGLALCNFLPWSSYSSVWWTWFVGDAVGIVVISPLILALHNGNRGVQWRVNFAKFIPFILLLICMACVLMAAGQVGVFALPLNIPLLSVLPLLIWSVFLYGPGASFFGVFFVTGVNLFAVYLGWGNYASLAENITLIELKVFWAITAITILILVAVVSELKASKKAAVEANDTKDEFLSRMSHELRTPLNAVIGFSERMIRSSDRLKSEQIEDVAKTINHAGYHLLGLVDDVLDITQLKTSNAALDLQACDIAEIVNEAVDLCRPQMDQKQIELTVEVDSYLVIADAKRLRQVVANLISNAVKYNHDKGKIQIKTQLAGERVKLSVVDSGVGIAEKDAEKIFEAFQRLDYAKHNTIDGVGLGLTISKEYIDAMAGTLSFCTVPQGGTEFLVTIPISRESKATTSAQTL